MFSWSSVARLPFGFCDRRRRPGHGTDLHPPGLGPGFCIHLGYRRLVRAEGGGDDQLLRRPAFLHERDKDTDHLAALPPVDWVKLARGLARVAVDDAHL